MVGKTLEPLKTTTALAMSHTMPRINSQRCSLVGLRRGAMKLTSVPKVSSRTDSKR